MIQRLRQILPHDQVAQRLVRNLKWIFSSQVAMAILGMISLAVSARALGAAGLGALALIEHLPGSTRGLCILNRGKR